MVRHLTGLAIALLAAAPVWAGELDGDSVSKERKAPLTLEKAKQAPSSAAAIVLPDDLRSAPRAATGSELDRESPTQAARGGGGGGRGWGGGGRGWGGGWGGGRGWGGAGWGGRGWGGWGRGWGGWGRGYGWYGYPGWGWGGGYWGWGGGYSGWGGGWGWGYSPYYASSYLSWPYYGYYPSYYYSSDYYPSIDYCY
ncbi:MAG TPA: hypothetical protein VK395_06310 [Gemmataceae bacterium]|nr:hypothetical protein [Gemmataceae bacterium]